MLLSSSEYIKALHEGKYLLFLEWVDFITQKYELMGAEDTVNFLILEWLSNDYSEEDAKKVAVLQAVYDLESKTLQGKLDYSLKIITTALFMCMVFRLSDINVSLTPQKKIKPREADLLIAQNLAQLNPFTYKKRLEDMQTQFYQYAEGADQKEVVDAFKNIRAITEPRYLLEDYILHLERIKIKDDKLYATRLSMAKRFLGYLYEQTELTPKVAEVIATYVNSLRELGPGKGELACLDNICPPSALENTWRWVTGIGIGFFSLVLHEKSISELISGKDGGLNP
ncbi:helical bundle domain-containing protein [Legionella sp. PATHC038]|uniref:helical bundle domain-containing protein n=1 Tax=Legionella sheltonii TaxID=2992041 RepID=UPI0022442DA1|nr:helical bundle domain-containing protein [Legionella sp. PATHC038]MCW8397541.1 helical bundle domain-containing protein [Legionella sp. PATHC038]